MKSRTEGAHRYHRQILAAAAVVGAVAAGGGLAMAQIPDASGKVFGCYSRSGGALRVIDGPSQSCSKTETSLNWNQSGPQGPTGPAGAPGATGPQGVKGDTGATGRTGDTGATGASGATGATGATGRTGTDGATGPAGPAGRDGVNGLNGLNGFNGRDGEDGEDGSNGTNGTNGANGKDGFTPTFHVVVANFEIPVSQSGASFEVLCPDGEQATGGGYTKGDALVTEDGPKFSVLGTHPFEPVGWRVHLIDPNDSLGDLFPEPVTMYVICASEPPSRGI